MASRRWVRAGTSDGQRLITDFQQASRKRSYYEPSVNIVWHKWSDLRLLDHEPLVRAHARTDAVLHVHVVELSLLSGTSRVGQVPRCSSRRAAFWRECVSDLSQQLEERGQHLLVAAVDCVATFFSSLCDRFPVATVFTHREFCSEELKVEAQVRQALLAHDVKLETFWGGLTVHHIDDLGFDPTDPSQMPMFKGEFNKVAKKRPIREVLSIPKLRASPELQHSDFGPDAISLAFSTGPTVLPVDQRQVFVWVGGETAALKHLRWYIDSDQLKNYRGATESFATGEHNPLNGGTRLSPWLAFGCISARMVVHEARRYERMNGKHSSTGKGSGKMGSTGSRLHTELMFRDFLRFATFSWGNNLFKVGGPFQVSGIEWNYNQEMFAKWKAGQTGYPFVDAGMRELTATGYMSHLHRQCCAAFLVRDLGLDWRMGAEHFEACLLDHTPDANWGNWAYRILQRPGLVESRKKYPVAQHISTIECISWPVIHDARLEHTLRWLPELSGLPRDLAREPWRTESVASKRLDVKPYKDSPLWFCAANRANWHYEYFWLAGHAWTVVPQKTRARGDFRLGDHYPRPLVPPLNLEVDLDALPVAHGWGDTDSKDRPHIWGVPGCVEPKSGTTRSVFICDSDDDDTASGLSKGKSKSKGKGKGKHQGAKWANDGSQNINQKKRWQQRQHGDQVYAGA